MRRISHTVLIDYMDYFATTPALYAVVPVYTIRPEGGSGYVLVLIHLFHVADENRC